MYLAIKHIHMLAAVLSILGFTLRGIWVLRDSPLKQHKLTKVLPHIIDTLLLGSAICLAVTIGQYPFQAPWLTAKVIALLAYIGLGLVAFRFAAQKWQQALAYLAALGCALYILAVARFKDPALSFLFAS